MNPLRPLRDYYHKHKEVFDIGEKVSYNLAFILSAIVVFFGIWDPPKSWDIGHSFETLKFAMEFMIFVYFLLMNLITWSNAIFLDPLWGYFRIAKKMVLSVPPDGFTIVVPESLVEIDSIRQFATKLWGADYKENEWDTRHAVYESWHQTLPDIFSIVYDDGKPVGFISVIPLSNKLHFENHIEILNIEPTSIKTAPHSSQYVLIHGIYLAEGYRTNDQLIQAMQAELIKKIRVFMSPKFSFLYSPGQYLSSRHFFSQNGFGKMPSKTRQPPFYCLPFENYTAPDPNNPAFRDFSFMKKYSARKRRGITALVSGYNDDYLVRNNSDEQSFKFWDKPLLGMFFDENFSSLADQGHIMRHFLGKTLHLYTHSVYSNDDYGDKIKEHSLGISVITFNTKVQDNYISCNFRTASRSIESRRQSQYLYSGACFFTKKSKDIVMIFHPKFVKGSDGNWNPDPLIDGDPPTIITGRIIKVNNDTIDDQDEGLLSLNFVTFSRHTKTTLSKIALLSLKDEKANAIDFERMFVPMQIEENDPMKTIKSFLMRTNKVFIKGLEGVVINNKKDIDNWFAERFKLLRGKVDIDYELYYYRSQHEQKVELGVASMRFLNNGIAILKRRCKTKKSQGTEVNETYYGEINIRHFENRRKLLYIKFLEIDPDIAPPAVTALPQNYRELLFIFFWPDKNPTVDFTRGMLLGDRDINDTNEDVIINANDCVLCTPTPEWKARFDSNEAENAGYDVSRARLEKVYRDFITIIFDDINLDKPIHDNLHTIDSLEKILRTIQLRYTEKWCTYKQVFKDS